ncbi:hypothetical protein G6N82_06215 [Altererythrobacter sp. BO-6]|nr:hypothetical protein G6N82_06215 [Altererythrobacter sp. BO-6]
MKLKSYEQLNDDLEAERLRLREHSQTTGRSLIPYQSLQIVTADFVKSYSDDALTRWMHENETSPHSGPKSAAQVMRAELALRANANSRTALRISERAIFWAKVAAMAAVAAALGTFLPMFVDVGAR